MSRIGNEIEGREAREEAVGEEEKGEKGGGGGREKGVRGGRGGSGGDPLSWRLNDCRDCGRFCRCGDHDLPVDDNWRRSQ